MSTQNSIKNEWQTLVAVLLLIVGVNLVANDNYQGWWGLVGGGCLGLFAAMAVRR